MFCSTKVGKVFISDSGKVHLEGLVHLLGYIRDNKNLLLRYYAKIEDAPLSELLIQARIKTEKQLMVLYGSNWQYCPDNGRSTGAYIVFYQCRSIDNFINVPVPVLVDQYSDEIDYNTA